MKLWPIAEWGLNIDKKTIPVNTETFQTNKEGIFAIGDICTYPGKLKLILSGFHEGALAARACFKRAKPNETYRFEFTTASKNIHARLGLKKWSSFSLQILLMEKKFLLCLKRLNTIIK
jgi:thioredoxin reductase (NADPH)